MTGPVLLLRVRRNLREGLFPWRGGTKGARAAAATLVRALRPLARGGLRRARGRAAVRLRRRLLLPPGQCESPLPEVWLLDRRRAGPVPRLAAVVNGLDHLVLQLAAPGGTASAAARRVLALAARAERRVPFARNRRWGWLTASPADAGAGLRAVALVPAAWMAAGLADGGDGRLRRAGLAAAPAPAGTAAGTWQVTHAHPLGRDPGPGLYALDAFLARCRAAVSRPIMGR